MLVDKGNSGEDQISQHRLYQKGAANLSLLVPTPGRLPQSQRRARKKHSYRL